PCDLCDHSQISHIVRNDVKCDILLTTLHVITDWPISDHMIGTSYREVPYNDRCSTVSRGHSGHWIEVLHAPCEHAQAGKRGGHL
ncbi:unnamed protein product, partial [Staurois parvus]